MDPSGAAVVVIAHDNGLLGAGLALLLDDRLGVPCCAVRAHDPAALGDCLGPAVRVVVLECPHPEAAERVLALAPGVPVVDVTGVVRGPRAAHAPDSGEALAERVRALLDAPLAS